jgi:hypothetical protein
MPATKSHEKYFAGIVEGCWKAADEGWILGVEGWGVAFDSQAA